MSMPEPLAFRSTFHWIFDLYYAIAAGRSSSCSHGMLTSRFFMALHPLAKLFPWLEAKTDEQNPVDVMVFHQC